MKLKIFNYKVTKSTTVDLATITARIISELSKPGYKIISKTKNSIEFKYDIWRVASRSEAFNRIDRGKFEIITGEDNLIIFSYYTYSSFEIIAILALVIASILVDYHIFFFVIVFFIVFLSKVVSLKQLADEMLEKIASPSSGTSV
jgi:hypothetical protein